MKGIHTHQSSAGNDLGHIIDDRSNQIRALTAERDAFKAKAEQYAKCLEYIELTGSVYAHLDIGKPCGCGQCMSEEAFKALGGTTMPTSSHGGK